MKDTDLSVRQMIAILWAAENDVHNSNYFSV